MRDEPSSQVRHARDLILAALRDPGATIGLGPSDWDLLLRLARRCRLLGRLAAKLADAGAISDIPARAAAQLRGALVEVHRLQQLGRWEANRLSWALDGTDIPVTLLKGTAYLLADLPPAHGRMFADVDALFPEERLHEVEAALVSHGWFFKKLNDYDRRYYREWMHELPPMRHRERETEVDLHHNIVPRTARLKIDPTPLLAAARPVGGSRLRVLAPHDMVLHSAVHLFHDGDMVNGLRELVDIDDLLRHFGQQAGFWDALVPRATALGVSRPLFYGLHYCRKLLETPIPEDVMAAAASAAPQTIILAVMDRLVPAALLPQHPDLPRRTTAFARWLLFVRSHYLRMPMRLLIPHLTRKAWRRVKGEEAH